MKTFTIDNDNNISVFGTPEGAPRPLPHPSTPSPVRSNWRSWPQPWPAERLVEIGNSLAGVKPVKSFKSARVAAGKIWDRIQSLGEPAKAKATPKAKSGAPAANAAPAKGKATKEAAPAKKAPKA